MKQTTKNVLRVLGTALIVAVIVFFMVSIASRAFDDQSEVYHIECDLPSVVITAYDLHYDGDRVTFTTVPENIVVTLTNASCAITNVKFLPAIKESNKRKDQGGMGSGMQHSTPPLQM